MFVGIARLYIMIWGSKVKHIFFKFQCLVILSKIEESFIEGVRTIEEYV